MARRYRVTRKTPGGKSKSYYVTRDAKGRFKKWTNINRSIRADARKKYHQVKTHPKKPGYGHTGDYKQKLKGRKKGRKSRKK